ncbi:sensor protein lytS [Spirosoma sp. HMF4905]|uniref:Sensor protein lytS n=1 Tax=Spirosoma arboris TaxID=2682092 RepID=A0A7K1SN77_9BACT|nr:sensor histidine kinase [Spirosoma arboris]MVM35056.1 sensor protein lytS [Spirosoma arboris]
MRHTVKDIWIRVVGIALLTALLLVSDDTYQQPINGPVLVKFLFALTTIIITWHLNRAIIIYYRTRALFPTNRTSRWLFTFLSCGLATTLVAWLMAAFEYGAIHGTVRGFVDQLQTISITLNQVTVRLSSYGFDWLHGLVNALFYTFLYGIVFFIRDSSLYRQRLEQAEREKEQLRVTNLQSQLDVLKQQVNPHFLFNALNSLSALIAEDPKQAEEFLDKLSGVYRYVLRANEQHLTTLEAELSFIDAYYHLLKTRYGDGLTLTVAVEASHRSSQLPPLTLQLLVENAVKHNVVSPKRPLSIQIISTSQTELIVSNTLQRKQTHVLSNGVGLTNIISKYQLMNLPIPVIDETKGQFIVSLPLLLEPTALVK